MGHCLIFPNPSSPSFPSLLLPPFSLIKSERFKRFGRRDPQLHLLFPTSFTIVGVFGAWRSAQALSFGTPTRARKGSLSRSYRRGKCAYFFVIYVNVMCISLLEVLGGFHWDRCDLCGLNEGLKCWDDDLWKGTGGSKVYCRCGGDFEWIGVKEKKFQKSRKWISGAFARANSWLAQANAPEIQFRDFWNFFSFSPIHAKSLPNLH